ncbi:10177_t:CDS:2 [Diversispora eburnea]|uniref:mRNA cap guanine-N(7) methyltransferase n=1 Tax=Diversispora eburnea TaxID=1213867 RepID=A0A9N9A4W5_9GLOM|nr:10177_t:CDS:2 [Diversispora eburnea]
MSYQYNSNTSSSKRKPDDFNENVSSNKSRKTFDGATPQHVVANHYNNIEDKGKQRRLESKIIFLRNFNNWVKSVLIGKNTPEQGVVLDIGCGKGGDLLKWGKAKISKLVGLDVAEVSINDAKNRWGKIDHKFDAEFHVFDCFSKRISMIESIKNIEFDVVSMQFCLHYSFETEEKAKMALQNISSNLKKGGSFIGTSLRPDQLEFGNSIYSIRFEQKNHFPTFGHKYWFNLEDAINDCPEYLVHFPTFKRY